MRSERRKLREVQNVISIIIDEDMRKIYLGYLLLDFSLFTIKMITTVPQNYRMLKLLFYVENLPAPNVIIEP